MIFPAKAVIFDLDGVLLISETANVESARAVLSPRGIELDAQDELLIVGRHPIDYLPELVERHQGDPSQIDAMLAEQAAFYDQLALEVELVPGAKSIVGLLSERGLRMAVATASEEYYARECLERGGIYHAFDHLCTKDDVQRLKPNPEVYQLALDRLGLEAHQAIAVEDSRHGIAAAKAAGLRCLALRNEYFSDAEQAEADFGIDSLLELADLIEAM